MRFKVEIIIPKNQTLCLPLAYQEIIQGILYKNMPRQEAAQAHDFQDGKRKYQKFTFSRLYGVYDLNLVEKWIEFAQCHFYVSSIDDNISVGLMKKLSQGIEIEHQYYTTHIQLLSQPDLADYRIEMLSPVTVRRTQQDTEQEDSLLPNTIEFAQAIYQNLCHKYEYFYGRPYKGSFAIAAIPSSIKEVVTQYKTTYIKGYMGQFDLIVSKKAMHLLHNVGLGERNAQGNGMFRMEEEDV